MRYVNYDATEMFLTQWNQILREENETLGKPRLQKSVADKRAIVLELFASFINHTLAAKYPGRQITPLGLSDAANLLHRIRSRPLDSEQKRITPTVEEVLSHLRIWEQGKFVDVKLKILEVVS